MSRILNRKPFTYSYSELLKTKLLRLFCCCGCCKRAFFYDRRLKRYESYLKVKETLTQELDMLQLVKESRMVKLLAEILLTLRQQCLLKYSRDYNLTADREMYKQLKQDIDTDVWNLVKGFDPDANVVDQKLLYMITGRGRDKQGGVDE